MLTASMEAGFYSLSPRVTKEELASMNAKTHWTGGDPYGELKVFQQLLRQVQLDTKNQKLEFPYELTGWLINRQKMRPSRTRLQPTGTTPEIRVVITTDLSARSNNSALVLYNALHRTTDANRVLIPMMTTTNGLIVYDITLANNPNIGYFDASTNRHTPMFFGYPNLIERFTAALT